MGCDLVFIVLFLDRTCYRSYRNYLEITELSKDTSDLLAVLDDWYATHEEGNPTLETLYFSILPHREKKEVERVFALLKTQPVPETAVEALRAFKRKRLYEDISVASMEAAEGIKGASQRLYSLNQSLAELEEETGVEKDPFFNMSLDTVLEATDRTGGFEWRLRGLRERVGNLLPGEFGFFVARPETGKTTMLASEITHMAEQLEGDRPIIWFNNEEPGAKVSLRLYQAALGATEEQIRQKRQEAIELYKRRIGDRIKLVDVDYLTKAHVEAVCEKYKPALIILDQIDPIKGFKADREDLKLGEIYKWARALAKKHKMPVIAVCQADGSAEGVQWLRMDNVANAKTEKQAAADWIIGIGKVHQQTFSRLRFLSVMKNKLTGKHDQFEVLIKPEIARYEDIN